VSPEALGWYASIFLWLFLTGIGVPPCPEEAGILYAASVTALHEEVRWWLAWPLTGAGIVCADMVLYWAGRLWGSRLFDYRWVQPIIKPERRRRIDRKFHKHGMKILLMARFLPPLRTGIFIIAGGMRYSFLRFLITDAGYAVFGVALFFFGGTWLVGLLHYAGSWAVYVVVALFALYALYRYYRYLQARELRGEPTPPVSVLELPDGATPGGAEAATAPTAPEATGKQITRSLLD
jgi:membrane protein DedA with SNARE-associated domain